MKKTKQISLIVLLIMLVLNSCTMEKRVYMSGYQLEWKNKKHPGDKQDLKAKAENKVKTEKYDPYSTTVPAITNETSLNDNPEINDDNIIASSGNSFFFPANHKLGFIKKYIKAAVSKNKLISSEPKTIIKDNN